MTARGKREAKRSASPLVTDNQSVPALKGRNSLPRISAFRALLSRARDNPGRRASRLPWAFIYRAVGAHAGCHVSRRWRLPGAVIFRTVNAPFRLLNEAQRSVEVLFRIADIRIDL